MRPPVHPGSDPWKSPSARKRLEDIFGEATEGHYADIFR
jgi:hypothetical protein